MSAPGHCPLVSARPVKGSSRRAQHAGGFTHLSPMASQNSHIFRQEALPINASGEAPIFLQWPALC